MKNPFFSSGSNEDNSTDADVIRLVFSDAFGNTMTPNVTDSETANTIYIPTPEAVQGPPIEGKSGYSGYQNLSIIGTLTLEPKMSLTISVTPFIAVILDNGTVSASNGSTTTQDPTTTTASLITPEPVRNISVDEIAMRIYVRIGEHVSRDDYDYICDLPSNSSETSTFTTYSDNANNSGLPPEVTQHDLLPHTCFWSDKELYAKVESTVDVYYGVEWWVMDVVEEDDNTTTSERKKRSTDDSSDYGHINVWFSMSTLSSQCRYWDPNYDVWNTDGCEVGPLTTLHLTHCLCKTLGVQEEATELTTSTTAAPKAARKFNPFGGVNFGAAFKEPFNTFDPLDTSAWTNLDENPLIFSVMVALMCFYLCCLIWARRWDMKDTVAAGASPLLDNDPQDSYLYELTVFTGTSRGAGTSAKVSMIFAGLEEETPPRLIYDDKRPILQSGGVDSFLMSVPRPLGPLNHIRVWHDNGGKSPSWQFAYMCVIDLITRDKFFFVSNSWLSVSEGDGAIDRMIPTATREDLVDFSHLFWTKARKDLTDSHIWFSVFGRPPKSSFTRVQRITCCLTLLFSSMAANIMLYKDNDSTAPSGSSIKIMGITLTPDEIITGIFGSLMVFPINLVIVYIFRNSKHRESKSLRDAKKKTENYEKEHEKSLANLRASRGIAKPAPKKCSLSSFLFPWWFQFIAYFLCLATCGVSFWVCVQMGGVFGSEKSNKWMISFVTSFFESLLLSQPIKVVLFAMFYALVIRSPTIEDELDNDPGLLQGEEYLHLHNKNYNAQYLQLQKSLARYKVLPIPPQPEFIAAAKRKRQKEKEMQAVLREILGYVIFLYLLYMCTYGTKDPWSWRYYNTQQNALEHGFNEMYGPMIDGPGYQFEKPLPMSKVGDMKSFWYWTKHTYIPYIYGNTDYGSRPSDKGSINDGVSFLVGNTRIRQLRVKKVVCPPVVYKYEQECAMKINKHHADTADYGVHWQTVNSEDDAALGFTYENSTVLKGMRLRGLLDWYEGGGYSMFLGRTQQSAAEAIDYLQENNWIDKETRSVFIEFTLYNTQINLYSVSFIKFELLPTGAIYPKFDLKLLKIDRWRDSFGITVFISEMAIIIYTIYFIVTECKELKKQKLEYFKDFWNKVELLMLALMLTMQAMQGYRFYLMYDLGGKVYDNPDDYIAYHAASGFEQSYLYLLAFLVFIATTKFLKLLRFNKKMNVLGYTLLHIAGSFGSFMIAFLLMFIAYSHMAFLVFNTLLYGFSSITRSMTTLFTLMLNKFDYKSMEQANKYFAPLIFATFTVTMGFMLVNFMLSLIIDGFTTVRAELDGKPNQYEIVDFVVGKFKAVMGLGSDTVPTIRDRKEDFVEDSQKELDMKFGEFSERVFGMFLQDPDDIKTMKMAENMVSYERKLRSKKKKIVFI